MKAQALSGLAIGLWVAWTYVAAPAPACAQEPSLGPQAPKEGPTRAAVATTARSALEAPRSTPHLMRDYLAFEQDFADDFGPFGPRISDRVDGLLGLRARLEDRWGGTPFYQWIERGLSLYARLQASTHMEKKGFDIKVKTDDVAEGKLGVRMSRPLTSGSPE